jgi:hypothetical protein
VIRVLYGRKALHDILRAHGDSVVKYSAMLAALAAATPDLKAKLEAQEADARVLAQTEPHTAFAYTLALLSEMAAEHDWEAVRERAARHVESSDPVLATTCKRFLALGLAHSEEQDDKRRATDLYKALAEGNQSDPTDAGNLATLLMEAGTMDEAKSVVLKAIVQGPVSQVDYYGRIGHRIAEASGDRDFRNRLMAAIAERG